MTSGEKRAFQPVSADRCFAFGPFELLTQSGNQLRPAVLKKNGTPVEAFNKSAFLPRLLLHLIDSRDRPSPINPELVNLLWPDGNQADAKRGVANYMKDLRELLDDKEKPHRYVDRARGAVQFIYQGVVVTEVGQGTTPASLDGTEAIEVPWSPLQPPAGTELLREIYQAIEPNFERLVRTKDDRFLNYDPKFLFEAYAGETPIAEGLTYTEICDFLRTAGAKTRPPEQPITVRVESTPFAVSIGSAAWRQTAEAGYNALFAAGRMRRNETIIRVVSATPNAQGAEIVVQSARYHDQGRSNLILDFDRENPATYKSLRSQLAVEYNDRLPLLRDQRLANTLGVAALLLYRDDDSEWVPYMVRRVERIGVFPGGIHCTASGVAKWPDNPQDATLFNFATRHMLDELREEVGLTPGHLLDFQPVAFCREFARAGKPQLFYVGLTLLDRAQLKKRRQHAARVIKSTGDWPEVERDLLFRSGDFVLHPTKLRSKVIKEGLTLEGAAALFYGFRYAQLRLPYLVIPKAVGQRDIRP